MAVNVGQGTILRITISSTLTAVAQVLDITGPGITVEKIKKTNLADVAVRYRAGLPEGDPCTYTIQYDPADATHQALITAASTWPQQLMACTETYNTIGGADKATFNAFVSKFSPKGMNQEDNLEADVELQPDGIPVFI
jgi:hypothetical protein